MQPSELEIQFLESVTRDFIKSEFRNGVDKKLDEETVHAVRTQDMERRDREAQLRKWLNFMKVIRFYPKEIHAKIVGQILAYADGPRPGEPLGGKAAIVSEYERLRECIEKAFDRPRGVTSLASKALWCCYPNDVPIFDGNACKALAVMSRLWRMVPEPDETAYTLFVDLWLQLYEKLKTVIQQADIEGYPYRIRVLDQLLWYLGGDL